MPVIQEVSGNEGAPLVMLQAAVSDNANEIACSVGLYARYRQDPLFPYTNCREYTEYTEYDENMPIVHSQCTVSEEEILPGIRSGQEPFFNFYYAIPTYIKIYFVSYRQQD